MTSVSVVTTARDEAATIDQLLQSLLAQTRAPDEIIVVDDGSRDETASIVAEYERREPRLRLLRSSGLGIAGGRNLAIANAGGPIIAQADAGTIPAPDWLAQLVRPLEEDESIGVSSGYVVPGGSTWLERCLTSVITPHVREIDASTFLPWGGSVAFRRDWWERVGGYPEWLRHCEDLVFGLRLRDGGARFYIVPEALVEWSARPTLRGFFRQYLDYGRGDGRANLWPARHVARYSAYGAGLVLLAATTRRPVAALALAAGVGVRLGPFYRRLWRHRPFAALGSMALATAVVPAIVVVGDVAKMTGYPLGRRDRARAARVRRPPSPTGTAP